MRKLAVAESALVSKLEIARSHQTSYHNSPPASQHRKTTEPDSKKSPDFINTFAHSNDDENEMRDVLNLEVPRFDKNRTFQGLEKQKMAKKDRHMKALDEFAKTLEVLAEEIEIQVLETSRTVRDRLESLDLEIRKACDVWKNDENLVSMSSEGLDEDRAQLTNIISQRLETIQSFAAALEDLECQRAEKVGEKIKSLVDTLISIAHQLPDEIEHIVEAEAFDLNTVLTKNRRAHTDLLGVMRTKQVEREVSALHEWDVAKAHWRHLRHQQAISLFHRDINSASFTEPKDRQEFLRNVRIGQQGRQSIREEALADLSKLNSETISTPAVVSQQQILQQVNEEELNATQECYNGLSELRVKLRKRAEKRMEELRVELHRYGALCEEPSLQDISNQLKAAIGSPELAELWRIGGGLKSDVNSVAADFTSSNIFYDDFLRTVQERLELLVCGFNIKEVLNERGRLPRLDIVRNLLAKSRTVPRSEVANVITSLLPDLKEMSLLEKMSPTFQRSLLQCIDGIEKELLRVAQETAALTAASPKAASGTASFRTVASMKKTAATLAQSVHESSTLKGTRRSGTRTMKNTSTFSEVDKPSNVDPNLVKQWTRLLGILYYGCDLPPIYQQVCPTVCTLIFLNSLSLPGVASRFSLNQDTEVVQRACGSCCAR
jgi:hypothetical protein